MIKKNWTIQFLWHQINHEIAVELTSQDESRDAVCDQGLTNSVYGSKRIPFNDCSDIKYSLAIWSSTKKVGIRWIALHKKKMKISLLTIWTVKVIFEMIFDWLCHLFALDLCYQVCFLVFVTFTIDNSRHYCRTNSTALFRRHNSLILSLVQQ